MDSSGDALELTALLLEASASVERATGDQRLGSMFLACMSDTLARTMRARGDGSVFVVTGDIPAMWLRDSSAQLRPFMPLLTRSAELRRIVAGVVACQFASINIDPYANAFNDGPTGAAYDSRDPCAGPSIWERKYEVDSLALPVQLLHRYWAMTGDESVLTESVHAALALIVATWRTEQAHETRSAYRFERFDVPDSETLERAGLGTSVASTGMTWCGFRPSDDACRYGYNIPAQLCAARALRQLAEVANTIFADAGLASDALELRAEIIAGVERHGVVDAGASGRVYAYEVDGLGHSLLMDDANMPSLLSLPLTSDVGPRDETYLSTRRLVLSHENPYFYAGTAATGIGSPHTPEGYIWHIALAVEGLTSNAREDKLRLLTLLRDTDGGTGFMHEGFDKDDPEKFTRPWFSWANSMFCELLLDYSGFPGTGAHEQA